jgi:hypothetical protein
MSSGSSAKRWNNVYLAKTESFTGCLLNVGVIRQPTVASYCFISYPVPVLGSSYVLQLSQHFHLMDERNLASPVKPGYNWCTKTQPVNRAF